jgi:hypothetical protein
LIVPRSIYGVPVADTDVTHLYCVLRGGYTFSSPETWQTGFRLLAENNASTPDNIGALVPFTLVDEVISRTETDWTIVGDYSVHFGTGSDIHVDDWLNDQIGDELRNVLFPHASNKVQLREIHVWPIQRNGLVAGGHTCVLAYTGSLPGGSNSGNPLPVENTPVVSLQTGRIGRHGRGRMFWPVQAASEIDATGLWTHADRDALATDFATFFHDIAITGGLGHSEWLLPIVTGKPYSNYAVVTGVRVGDVMDTQRRRRRALTEVYHHEDVSY